MEWTDRTLSGVFCVCLRRIDCLLCVTLQISNNAVLVYFLGPDTNVERPSVVLKLCRFALFKSHLRTFTLEIFNLDGPGTSRRRFSESRVSSELILKEVKFDFLHICVVYFAGLFLFFAFPLLCLLCVWNWSMQWVKNWRSRAFARASYLVSSRALWSSSPLVDISATVSLPEVLLTSGSRSIWCKYLKRVSLFVYCKSWEDLLRLSEACNDGETPNRDHTQWLRWDVYPNTFILLCLSLSFP